MARKAELKAVLSLDTSPFVRGTKHALATGKALAVQFAKNPVKFAGTAALLGVEKGLRGAASGMKALAGAGLGAAAAGFRTLAMATPLATAGMAAGVSHAYNFGSQLQDMSDRTGIGVKNLVVLQTALKDAGIEFDALLPAMGKMQQALVKEAAGEGDGLFAKLGLDAKSLKEADPGETFGKVMEKIGAINNAAERADISKRLLGRSGLSFLSMARDPNAMSNARQAVGSQAEMLGANSGSFDRISDILGHATIKLRGFFVGIASGLKTTLLPLMERMDKLDFAEKGRSLAAYIIAGFDYAKDIIAGPIGKTFAWIGNLFQSITAGLQAAMEVVSIKMMNVSRGMHNVWDIMSNMGQDQQPMIEDKESFGTKVSKYKKNGWSLAGMPTGTGKSFGDYLSAARKGMGDEGEIGGRGNWKPTPEPPPWRLLGFGGLMPTGPVLKGASMAGALSRFQGFLSGDRDKSMRTLGMGDGSVTPLLRHSEMRAFRNARVAAGDRTGITDIAAGDARRQKSFLKDQERKKMAQGSDNQLLSSITKNTAAVAKRLGTVFDVDEGTVEGA